MTGEIDVAELEAELPGILQDAISEWEFKKWLVKKYRPGVRNAIVWLNRLSREVIIELDSGQTITSRIDRTSIRLEHGQCITTNGDANDDVMAIGLILQEASCRLRAMMKKQRKMTLATPRTRTASQLIRKAKQKCIAWAKCRIKETLGDKLISQPHVRIRTSPIRMFDSHYAVFRGETEYGRLVVDYWPGWHSPQFRDF
ncbi:hypothetical protein IH979_00635 [Patescibacteria group bacterium]|nr:hypothetical protein [Patescibacteria group bacterium]